MVWATVVAVLLNGLGSYLRHDGYRHKAVGAAAEAVGWGTLGVSALVDSFRPMGELECSLHGTGCPDYSTYPQTYLGFAWFVLKPYLLDATLTMAAMAAGWVVARLTRRGPATDPLDMFDSH